MTIEVLTARIASLEQELSQAKNAIEKNERGLKALESSSTPIPTNVSRFSEEDHAPSRQGESSSSRTRDETVEKQEPRALLDHDVQAAAVALAQLSLAPKAEFVGNGSVLSALHRVRSDAMLLISILIFYIQLNLSWGISNLGAFHSRRHPLPVWYLLWVSEISSERTVYGKEQYLGHRALAILRYFQAVVWHLSYQPSLSSRNSSQLGLQSETGSTVSQKDGFSRG